MPQRERLIDYWDRPGRKLRAEDGLGGASLLLEHLVELVSIPLQGEHYTRRPLDTVRQLGLEIVDTGRLHHGAIERVHARKSARR